MKKTFVKFCVLQACYWSFYAALPAYITAYMLEKGMSASTLGILLAIQMGCAFAGSIFWGRYVDRNQASRRFFLIGVTSTAIFGILLFLFAGNIPALFILYPLFGFMMGPIGTTLDSWAIAVMHHVSAGAKSRTFGTLGYAFTMLLSGQIISRFGYRFVPFIAGALILVAVLVALTQPEIEKQDTRKSPVSIETGSKGSMKEILRSRRYLLLVAVVFFTGMAIGPISNMKVLVFESVGGDVSFLGWDAFIGCLIQSPFLIFSDKIRRIKSEHRLLLGGCAALTYALLVFLARAPFMVVLGTIFTNISFGLLFPTMREITEESVSGNLRTTANSIVDVAYGSVANMIASAWSGAVMENAGTGMMCSICMVLEIVALGFALVLVLSGKKKSVTEQPSDSDMKPVPCKAA
ncbi:MAG: MFS transporter [Firmicutes bacterium]|nr:MFS transporter [Bacillota bacterium]